MSTNNAIEKEKLEKRKKKIYIIMLIGFAVVYSVIFLRASSIMAANKRLEMSEALNPVTFFTGRGGVPSGTTMTLWLGSLGIIILLIVMQYMEATERKHDNPDTVNGDAHFMNSEELAEYDVKRADPVGQPGHGIEGKSYNTILADNLRLSLDGKKCFRNSNILVIGGSGAGKSRYFASPNILQYASNIVVTDPSGELLWDYGKALEDNGYSVKVLNISEPYKGSRYNPFVYIHSEKDAYILVKTIMTNTVDPKQKGGEAFWDQTVELLLNAIILYIWNMCEPKDQTFDTVLKMINMAHVDENNDQAKSPLDGLFDVLASQDPDNKALYYYNLFKQGAGKTLKSIIISAGARLFPFSLPEMQYLTSKDDFDFDTFGDTRQAVFINIPTGDKSFNFLASTFYTQLFMRLYDLVDTSVITFGWQCFAGKTRESLKVFHGTRETTEEAKKRAERYAEKAKNLKIVYNKRKMVYYIKSIGKHTFITETPDERFAEWLKDFIMSNRKFTYKIEYDREKGRYYLYQSGKDRPAANSDNKKDLEDTIKGLEADHEALMTVNYDENYKVYTIHDIDGNLIAFRKTKDEAEKLRNFMINDWMKDVYIQVEEKKDDKGNVMKNPKGEPIKNYILLDDPDEIIAWRGIQKDAVALLNEIKKNGIRIEQCKRQCANHVRFILDEFANIGQIPNFSEKLATVRKVRPAN